jgi:predicted ATPase/DNA-binding CsgD family transcriptional regulator
MGYSTVTIRKIESNNLRPSRQIAEKLAQQLAVAPEERPDFIRWARSEADTENRLPRSVDLLHQSPAKSISHLSTYLPTPPTPLVGREQEVIVVSSRLHSDDVRLLTLTGPPGIGKTRLAIAVAHSLLAELAYGVYFIDLTPVTDISLVLPTIAYTLGIRQVTGKPLILELQKSLASKEMLLLVDNFEQVVQAAPVLTELLQAAPHLKLLVTSRELLHVSGEQNFPVPPLPLPPVLADQGAPRMLASLTPERLNEYAAVQLFVQRATALQPTFTLTPENALVVAGICCRLDGLPLAIELAAARIRHIPLPEIYERLKMRLHVLTGGARDLPLRQRTLRTAIEWSYNLLDSSERLLFVRLAVFRGGCSLEAAEAICSEELSLSVLDGLASLVDKSLVQQHETAEGKARFVLLEMIHEFAREQLEASGELEALRKRHAGYFVELTQRAEPELRLAHQKHWFHLLEMEIDNLRAALDWSLHGGDSTVGITMGITMGIRIVSSIFLYWYICGRQDEGIGWTQHLLARMNETEPTYQLRLLRSAAHLISYRDDEMAVQLSRQAVVIARDYGDKAQLSWALWGLGTRLAGEAGIEALAEAQTLFRELDEPLGLAHVLNSIGEDARIRGDDERARRAYTEALTIAERIGDIRLQYVVLYNSAFIAQHEGNHREAIVLLRRSLALCQEVGVPAEVARELLALAGSLGAVGELVQAARLFGAVETFFQRSGAMVHPADQPEHDRNIAFVRDQLGEAAFAKAWAEGQETTLEEALAYVHNISRASVPPFSVPSVNMLARSQPQSMREPPQFDPLTRREHEVAHLIAQGKSNRAIAEALVITERTVEGHVSNILSKLGFRSRAQVSAWVVAHAQPDR